MTDKQIIKEADRISKWINTYIKDSAPYIGDDQNYPAYRDFSACIGKEYAHVIIKYYNYSVPIIELSHNTTKGAKEKIHKLAKKHKFKFEIINQ